MINRIKSLFAKPVELTKVQKATAYAKENALTIGAVIAGLLAFRQLHRVSSEQAAAAELLDGIAEVLVKVRTEMARSSECAEAFELVLGQLQSDIASVKTANSSELEAVKTTLTTAINDLEMSVLAGVKDTRLVRAEVAASHRSLADWVASQAKPEAEAEVEVEAKPEAKPAAKTAAKPAAKTATAKTATAKAKTTATPRRRRAKTAS